MLHDCVRVAARAVLIGSLLLLCCCHSRCAYRVHCCPVKICKGCNAFRSKALGENAAEAAAAAAAEEEEEAGRPGETVLSYDSDELE